jgi:nucleotide-binding universal stress UspA family protein
MYKKILVPMDGSATSEGVAGWVTTLARRISAETVLLSVVDPDRIQMPGRASVVARETHSRVHAATGAGPRRQGTAWPLEVAPESGPPQMAPASGTQLVEAAVAAADSHLARQNRRLAASDVKIATKVVVGSPAQCIVEQAKEIGADLIAMATHRESPVARGVLGSVTDRVLHSTDLPVLAVHPKGQAATGSEAAAPKVVLVPLDGSGRSAAVVPIAIDLAAALGARIEFLSIVWRYYGAGWPDADWLTAEQIGPESRQEVFRYLDTFVHEAAGRGLTAHARAMFGNPAGRIIEESDAVEGALIVMSTRGATGFTRWALGSVTDKVIRSSGQPVLVVPPPA